MIKGFQTKNGKIELPSMGRLGRNQVKAILDDLGIKIISEGDTHYSVLCPFHYNKSSSAATVSKTTGYFWCFNPSCGQKYPVLEMVARVKRWDVYASMRYVEGHQTDELDLAEMIEEIYAEPASLPHIESEVLNSLQEEYWNSKRAQDYMKFRGFNEFSTKYFGIGYDPGVDMILTPTFSTDGDCVGLIGRSIAGKAFKNSEKLPTKQTLFNIYNAKRAGTESLVLVESNFDAIRIHQAGFRNVCATLGGTFSDYHMTQIYRSFNEVILMTDDDSAGLKFAEKIGKKCRKNGIGVLRAKWDEYNLFPNGAKDVCDQAEDGSLLVSEQDIGRCINSAEMLYL